MNKHQTCEWFISLYWRWPDKSYQRSGAHLDSFLEGSSVHSQTHTHPTANGFVRPVRPADDLESNIKSLTARTQKRWESLLGTIECLLHEEEWLTSLHIHFVLVRQTHSNTNNTWFTFKLSYCLTTARCVFCSPLCITTSKQFIYSMVEFKTGCRGLDEESSAKKSSKEICWADTT